VTDPSRQNQPSTWALGDYPAMAQRLVDAAVVAVEAANIRPGHTVLDVGTGTGNAAVLAARAGGMVTGVDPTPELLAVAADRVRRENLTVMWQQGTAEGVDAADHSFDRVLSVFGAMYTPNPTATARETPPLLPARRPYRRHGVDAGQLHGRHEPRHRAVTSRRHPQAAPHQQNGATPASSAACSPRRTRR
jgi:SAM-dependent methyltransferase